MTEKDKIALRKPLAPKTDDAGWRRANTRKSRREQRSRLSMWPNTCLPTALGEW